MRTTIDASRSVKRYISLGLGQEWEVRLNAEEGAYRRPFCRIDLVGSTSFAQAGAFTTDLDLTAALILYPTETSSATEALMSAMAVEERIFEITNLGLAFLPAPQGLTAVKSSGGTLSGNYRYVVCAINRFGKTLASQAASVSGVSGKVTLAWTAIPEATAYQVFRGVAGSERYLAATTVTNGVPAASYIDTGAVTPNPLTILPTTNTAKISHPMRVPLYDYDGVGINAPALEADRERGDYLRITEPPSVSRMVDEHDDLMWAVAANIRLSWRRSSVVPSVQPLIQSFDTSEDVA